MVNYTKGLDELREAWFEYKRAHPNDKFLHVSDFVAGWNAGTGGIVRRFKQFSVVKFILSLWHSLASRQ